MSYPFRPPLGARATSDMAPLVNAEPNSSKGEIARGSHVLNGGVRVTSGKRTALGGIAPFSPFLPLPPAPTAEELRRQCNQDENQLSEGSQMIDTESEETSQWLQAPEMYQRRASSHDINEMPSSIIVENRKPTHNPAAFMIRSYSMPVATQRDFDAQLRAARLERKQRSNLAFTPAWSMSRTNSIEGDVQRSPLRTVQASEMNTISLTRTESRQVSKWESSNESSSPAESGTTSCSDETDVATPRAVSPLNGSTSFFDVKHEDTTRALGDLHIHPDHLQPPPFMVTSS